MLGLSLALPAGALGAAQGYRENDFGGFRNVLPPGQNGLANGVDIAAFLAAGQRPEHSDDQLRMYGDLVYAAPGLKPEDLDRFYKDASFGVRPEDVDRTYSPRPGLTILRDKQFGVPHIYGDTRADAIFGTGYAAAEDRLFFIDVLRHLGRSQLSSFAGGAAGNRAFDRDQWQIAPYTEEDLQRQVDQADDLYGAEGIQGQEDVRNYVDGVNAYIEEARLNPLKMPGEYAAIGRPEGPDDWKATDLIATAALVGGIFGKGGGGELKSGAVLEAAEKRFGKRGGKRVWRDFRAAEDPEAPTTVRGAKFPYERTPRKLARGSVALPDRGSMKKLEPARASTARDVGERGVIDGLRGVKFPGASSNALLVSGRESDSGHPLAVFGPQVAYFAPQILMEQDVHAPTLDARGAAFPGVNLYVQLGRGRDYAWSATSAGQDNIDTFALDLCEPDGGKPTLDSMHYRYRGACRPIEVLERKNAWQPTLADQTPAGSETLRAERTQLGIVTARATVRGKPVVYTKLRSTYFHEVDSARGFSDFNDPEKMKSPDDFMRAAQRIDYTFNWFYVDDRDIAYFNSGNNPVRGRGVDPNFPTRGLKRFEWQGFNPANNTAAYAPLEQHPRVVNQDFLTSWNNKQAPAYRAADDNFSFQSTHRVKPLDDRVKRGIRGDEKMSLPELVDAMEDAGTVDLRGDSVLPLALKLLRTESDPALRDALGKLEAWQRDGSHRRDRDRDGKYEHSEAIRIMDAWWPLWLEAEFEPTLGRDLFDKVEDVVGFDNEPNNHADHLGSAYQAGWYGYARKDLKAVLGQRARGPYSRPYCGGVRRRNDTRRGRLNRCRRAISSSLRQALEADPAKLYKDSTCAKEKNVDPQWCFDAVYFRPLGAVTQPLIHWINRPTFQQAVEIQGHRGR